LPLDRSTAARASSSAQRPMASGRDSGPDRRRMYLWRAVDHEGEVLDMLAQRRRGSRAALRLMRKLLKKQRFAPKLLVTDKLRLAPCSLMHRIPRRCTIGSARKMPRIGVSRRPGQCYVSGEAVRSHADFRRSSRNITHGGEVKSSIAGGTATASLCPRLRNEQNRRGPTVSRAPAARWAAAESSWVPYWAPYCRD